MQLQYESTLIAVRDIERSKRFYREVLRREVLMDLGKNAVLSGGIALQEDYPALCGFPPGLMKEAPHNMELYFETAEFDGFIAHLARFPEVELLHPAKQYPWQQRVVRFYDPDRHLIEVGESMPYIVLRLLAEGKDAREVSKLTMFPVEAVEAIKAGKGADRPNA